MDDLLHRIQIDSVRPVGARDAPQPALAGQRPKEKSTDTVRLYKRSNVACRADRGEPVHVAAKPANFERMKYRALVGT
jgi:hypothetical protein